MLLTNITYIILDRSRCSRRTMTIFQKMYILATIKKQLVVIQTTFWPMETGNQLLGFKIIFVLMVHTDGTTIWRPQSMFILSYFSNFMSIPTLINFLLFFKYLCILFTEIYNWYVSSDEDISIYIHTYIFYTWAPWNFDNFVYLLDSEIKLDEAAVLHYTYPKFSDLTSRRDRCGCKPTKEDVKRCFMLEFDRSVSSDSSLCYLFLWLKKLGYKQLYKIYQILYTVICLDV